jgi:hypothetical protein
MQESVPGGNLRPSKTTPPAVRHDLPKPAAMLASLSSEMSARHPMPGYRPSLRLASDEHPPTSRAGREPMSPLTLVPRDRPPAMTSVRGRPLRDPRRRRPARRPGRV